MIESFSDKQRLTYLLRKNGFTFDMDGAINKPKQCNSFHQNLLLSIYTTGGASLVNGRYYVNDFIYPVGVQRSAELVTAG
jgi:hypothetical protein